VEVLPMKPTWERGNVRLYLGDCREVLASMADASIDVVVTSPPYNTLPATNNPGGLHADRISGVNKWIAKAAAGYFDQRPEDEYQNWLRGVVGDCLRVARGLVWVNHKIRYRDGEAIHPARMLPFPIYSEIIWDRGGSMALNCRRFAPSHETILAFGRPHHWNDEQNTRMSVWRIAAVRDEGADTEHPCPFPIEIAARPILASTKPGDVVGEPYMGSGTTGVAAVQTGRSFVGIEIDPTYFEIAVKRIDKAIDAGALFAPVPPAVRQANLFGGDA
jgi:DNA modification methylase